ncbi:concanavalin A-like lectin/glucanase domain-containing protein [Bombardia bombarda]|uniref:Concanavalin A-like lectin/glucanase domain-containing protein n=1 Tax=Bombardia bombarda TaxID=252184 RepID=A0AA39XCH3_9PEZI|nr:concanavalin A-like lectin/glucanase domain-containing protein [Bombardia bombarda]
MLLFSRRLWPVAALCIRHVAGAYNNTVCNQRSYTISSDDLTFNPNAWNPDSEGFQCLSVQDSPPAFKATWAWSSDSGEVHSYPHVKLTAPALPVSLSNISALLLSAKWSMGPGSTPRPALSVDSLGLAERSTTANVAFDLFADRNAANAQNETMADTEIMIWVGNYGNAQPLGFELERSCFNTTHSLPRAERKGTNVFTWMATANRTGFSAEISPLLQYLWRNGLVSVDSHLGIVSFGSEAFHSEGNVTFSASEFDLHLVTGAAPKLVVGQLPLSCISSESRGVSIRPQGLWLSRVPIIALVGAVLFLTW